MAKDEFEKDIRQLNDQISPWQKGTAKLWSYSVSHETLDVKVSHPNQEWDLHIVCEGTQFMQFGETTWSNALVDVRLSQSHPEFFELNDRDRMRVICSLVRLEMRQYGNSEVICLY